MTSDRPPLEEERPHYIPPELHSVAELASNLRNCSISGKPMTSVMLTDLHMALAFHVEMPHNEVEIEYPERQRTMLLQHCSTADVDGP